MKTINLFIASSATSELLNKQKEALVKKCKELNTEFAEEDKDYYINPRAYDDLERRMDVFESHIKNDDVVVFLIDGTKDPLLEKKLQKAAKKFQNSISGKPELIVFVSNNIDLNYQEKIKKLLDEYGWLYENLDNTEYFLNNVEKRIKGYISQYNERQKQKKKWLLLIIVCVILVVVGVGLFLRNRSLDNRNRSLNKQLETKRLLIVGGGSARNYIDDERLDTNLVQLNPDYWWYAPMPSGDSYRMIAEEITNLKSDYKSRPYYPIILSAERARRDTLFRRTIDTAEFRRKGYVIGIHIGDDYLVAYGGNGAFAKGSQFIHNGSTIYEEQLDSIINVQAIRLKNNDTTDKIKIYTTNKNSGTLNAYLDTLRFDHKGLNNYLEARDNKQLKQIFSSIDSLAIDTKWIVLGSRYYKTENANAIPLTVFGTKHDTIHNTIYHDTIFKPIYVYFLVYKDNDSYRLPDATEDFLRAVVKGENTAIIDRIKVVKESDTLIKKNTILYEFN